MGMVPLPLCLVRLLEKKRRVSGKRADRFIAPSGSTGAYINSDNVRPFYYLGIGGFSESERRLVCVAVGHFKYTVEG